jgi:hypothetical protein
MPAPLWSPWRGLRRSMILLAGCDANAVDDHDASLTGTRDNRGSLRVTAPWLEERRDNRRGIGLGIEARGGDE